MYDTTQFSIPKSAENLFIFMSLLYPKKYRKKFGHEMFLVFQDMYCEEVEKNGKVGILFWLTQIADMTTSILEEHKNLLMKKGMKNYLRQTVSINKYNIIGFIFLLPFLLMFTTDLVSRIAQGDLTHYNRPVYHYLSQTPLYWTPVLYTIVIIFPLLAIVCNIIPLLHPKRKTIFCWAFVRKNLITFFIILAGLGCIAVIKLHDFLPCMLHGLLKGGLAHFSQMFPYCQNA